MTLVSDIRHPNEVALAEGREQDAVPPALLRLPANALEDPSAGHRARAARRRLPSSLRRLAGPILVLLVWQVLTSLHLADLHSDESTAIEEAVVGRATSIRNGGMFIDVFDGTAKVQLFVSAVVLSNSSVMTYLDLGDFVSATGTVRRTRRGELTVDVRQIDIVSKALRVPPAKFLGLRDTDLRQRKRYLDLIANEESRSRLLAARC